MDFVPRAPLPEEMPQLIDFLSRELRGTDSWRISDEYPLVFAPDNRRNIRAIFSGDQVVAHAAIKYLIIKSAVGLFKVAAIGSVVTAPNFRNQGYSQKVLEDCLKAAHESGADIAILWTNLYDFYRKLDFELGGTEISVTLDQPLTLPPLTSKLRFLCSNRVDPAALLQLYTTHTVGAVRSLEEVRKYLTIPNSRVYTAWDDQNQLKAFAVEGKGADLKGYIHEWAGGVRELLALFSHVRDVQKSPVTVILPSVSQNLLREFKKHPVRVNDGYLGMIRPIRLENLMSKMHRFARQMGITDFVFGRNPDGTYTIGRGDLLFTTSDPKVMTRVLFGPYDSTINVSKLDPILPIPMWIWGWDSV